MSEYIMCDGELYHYGVKGMKWGVKRAAKLERKATKLRSKGRNEKAEKYATAAKKQRAATERVRKDAADVYGKKTIDRIKNQSDAKSSWQEGLFGAYGSMKYNQFRAANVSRGKAAAKAVLASLGNDFTLGYKQYKEEWRL